MFFVNHDPPFVQHSDPSIPLIQSFEHQTLELFEFVELIERSKPRPQFAILEHIHHPYIAQTVLDGFLQDHYEIEEVFYCGVLADQDFQPKRRLLFKRADTPPERNERAPSADDVEAGAADPEDGQEDL